LEVVTNLQLFQKWPSSTNVEEKTSLKASTEHTTVCLLWHQRWPCWSEERKLLSETSFMTCLPRWKMYM